MFDEEWKDEKYGGVEGHWGIFNGEYVFRPLSSVSSLSPNMPFSAEH